MNLIFDYLNTYTQPLVTGGHVTIREAKVYRRGPDGTKRCLGTVIQSCEPVDLTRATNLAMIWWTNR